LLKVVILYNLFERLQKGEEKDFLAEEAIIEEIEAVEMVSDLSAINAR